MKSLGCVVVDGRPQVLKVAPRSAFASSNPYVLSTSLTGHVREHLATPKIIEAPKSFIELFNVDLPVPRIIVIDR
ncbi:MAG TPA: hypothetical protein VI137_12220 [Pseudolabrys sp.]